MRRVIPFVMVAGLLCAGAATTAAAQGAPTTPPAGAPPAPQADQAGRRGQRANIPPAQLLQVQDVLDGLEISLADRQLALSDQQYAPFIVQLKRLQTLRRQHQAERQRAVQELRRLVNQRPAADDAALDAQVKQLDDIDADGATQLRAAVGEIDQILTPRQRAQFRLFEEQMEQRKLQILTRVLSVPKTR